MAVRRVSPFVAIVMRRMLASVFNADDPRSSAGS